MSHTVPLTTALLPDDLALLQRLGEAASRYGITLWVVGGAVRDALLGLRVLDIDITSEMPAEELGPLLAQDVGGLITSHSQFGTVKLRSDGRTGRTLDLATARSERYARPGALPTVSLGTMADDLARRDFSINAMAASLAPDTSGDLLDTEGGFHDLERGVVRVLHERSFQDDATRMLRAVRYAARLGFRLDARTRQWLKRDLRYMDAISPARVRREVARMLEEESPVPGLLEAHRLGVLGAVHQALGAAEVRDVLQRTARSAIGNDELEDGTASLALLGALVYPVPAHEIAALSKRLDFTSHQRAVVDHVVRLRNAEPDLAVASPAGVDAIVGNAPRAAIEALAVASEDPRVRRGMARYLERVRTFRMPLTGDDLLAMGVPPGPEVGRLLRMVREARLEGRVRSRSGALALVREAREEGKL